VKKGSQFFAFLYVNHFFGTSCAVAIPDEKLNRSSPQRCLGALGKAQRQLCRLEPAKPHSTIKLSTIHYPRSTIRKPMLTQFTQISLLRTIGESRIAKLLNHFSTDMLNANIPIPNREEQNGQYLDS